MLALSTTKRIFIEINLIQKKQKINLTKITDLIILNILNNREEEVKKVIKNIKP